MASLTTLPMQDYITEQSEIAVSYNTLSAKFGDGYEQTADNGLNSKQQTWSVTYYALSESQSKIILDYLDTVRGTVPFYATPRGAAQQTWRLMPESLKVSHVTVNKVDNTIYRIVSFQLKRAYI